MKAITNGRLIIPDADGNFFVDRRTLIFDETIRAITPPIDPNDQISPSDRIEVIDAGGNFVAPGFINVHIHGCAGADTMDDAPDALSIMKKFLPTTGVTSFLPTTMTMPLEQITRAIDRIRRARAGIDGAKILGVNLEGPFISPKFCGAQDARNILRAEYSIIEPFVDVIKIITVAPEEVSMEFIERCRRGGLIVSLGHSAASYEDALDAIAHGASHVTHLFNAQTGLHHRRPGLVGAALDSDVVVELIADDVHVHPTVQRLVSKVKPFDRIVLITDSMRACGLGDGTFDLGGQAVEVRGALATLEDGTIAASVAPMNVVVRNFLCNSRLSIERVIESVTKNPACELGIYNQLGSLEIGKAADVIVFDDELEIKAAFVDGRREH